MKIIRPLIIFIGILVGILILADIIRDREADQSLPLPWVPLDLAEATEIINNNCPEMIDPETRLDSVLLSDEGQLIYFYTLPNRMSHNIDSIAFVAYLFGGVIEDVMSNSNLKMHRDSSVTMIFKYRDRSGEPIADISLGPEDYR